MEEAVVEAEAIPTPPETTSAPVVGEVEAVVFVPVVNPLDVKVVKAPASGVVIPMITLFNCGPPPEIVPVKVVAPNLVTVRVSVAKVISASSTRSPAVPAKVTLPAVRAELVMELEAVRVGMVTVPEPKVTARLVVVLMPRVPVPVMSKIALLPARTTEVELIVVAPVPVAKVLLPVTVVAPFKEIAPVPVENVFAPVCVNPAATVIVPFEVIPEVAVINPEIVGVAVQAVGFIVKVVAALPKLVAVEFVVPKFKIPAESMVRVPEVLFQEEVPPEAMTKAPVEFPMFVAAVPVALIFPVPVTVIPPVP